jgi:hypothetical protein
VLSGAAQECRSLRRTIAVWDGEARVGLATFSSRLVLGRRIDVFSGEEPDAGPTIEAYDSWGVGQL